MSFGHWGLLFSLEDKSIICVISVRWLSGLRLVWDLEHQREGIPAMRVCRVCERRWWRVGLQWTVGYSACETSALMWLLWDAVDWVTSHTQTDAKRVCGLARSKHCSRRTDVQIHTYWTSQRHTPQPSSLVICLVRFDVVFSFPWTLLHNLIQANNK